MNLRLILPIAVPICSLLLSAPANAVEIVYTGKITSGIDHGAIFSPVGTNLAGQKITVVFSDAPAAPGTTFTSDYVGATVSILGRTFDAGDNDIPTPLALVSGPPDSVYAQALQNFDLGYSETFAKVASTHPFVPAGADLNSTFSYRVQPGDMASGYFDLVNSSVPGQGYTGPPHGGPGVTPPWGDFLVFSVDNVFVNTASPVPEPAAWISMLAGFVGLGLSMRSSRGRLATPA
jgi:hypothetical protein